MIDTIWCALCQNLTHDMNCIYHLMPFLNRDVQLHHLLVKMTVPHNCSLPLSFVPEKYIISVNIVQGIIYYLDNSQDAFLTVLQLRPSMLYAF